MSGTCKNCGEQAQDHDYQTLSQCLLIQIDKLNDEIERLKMGFKLIENAQEKLS